jgi:glycosyltransferase involved in cell wall biosynthesis
MKVALIHDWIIGMRGGERCLLNFVEMYPEADIFTLIHKPGTTDSKIDSRVKKVSFLGKLPGITKFYRYLLPLFPLAIRGFNLSGYDLVISLSHAAAKNVTVPKGVPHICFCFTPMRYIWDQAEEYFGKGADYLWPLINYLRRWDIRGSRSVSMFVAISTFIAARIRCFYGVNSEVIYPAVDTSWIQPAGSQGSAFLYAGALVPYKKVDVVVETFNNLGEELWIVGGGPEEKRLQEMAAPNIKFFGRLSDAELSECYRNCRALIFPGTEDFGLIPIECMAAGRPIIGAHSGALRETHRGVKHWIHSSIRPEESTGVFIRKSREGDVSSLTEAVRYFLENESKFEGALCIEQAQKFSPENFKRSWNQLLQKMGLPKVASAQEPESAPRASVG